MWVGGLKNSAIISVATRENVHFAPVTEYHVISVTHSAADSMTQSRGNMIHWRYSRVHGKAVYIKLNRTGYLVIGQIINAVV